MGWRPADLTEGHRFHAPGAFAVASCGDWAAKLRERRVWSTPTNASGSSRTASPNWAAARQVALVDDPGLLDEVAGLVEWPVPLLGRIDDAYMDLPAEVRQVSMRVNQRYFALPQRRWLGRTVFRLRRQYRAGGRRRDLDRRQRARAARPLRRCAPLLGPRPQGAAGVTRAAAGPRHVPREAGLAGRARAAAGTAGRGDRPTWSVPARRWRATRRGWPRRTWSPAWSASSPNCRA